MVFAIKAEDAWFPRNARQFFFLVRQVMTMATVIRIKKIMHCKHSVLNVLTHLQVQISSLECFHVTVNTEKRMFAIYAMFYKMIMFTV